MVANAKEQVAKQVSKGKNRDAKRWKHDSFLLIEGSVNYTTLVSNVTILNLHKRKSSQFQRNVLF